MINVALRGPIATLAWLTSTHLTEPPLVSVGGVLSDLVDERDGVVGQEGVGSAGEFEVVGDVDAGFGGGHGWHRESEGDALIESGEGAEFDSSAQGWLTNEETREW